MKLTLPPPEVFTIVRRDRPKEIRIVDHAGNVHAVIPLPPLPTDKPDSDDAVREEIARVFGDDPEAA